MTQVAPQPAPPLPPSSAAPAAAPYYPPPGFPLLAYPPRRPGSRFGRFIFKFFFVCSIILNIILVIALSSPGGASLSSTTLESGSSSQVVAVYPVQGLIGEKAAADFRRFYEAVRSDTNVKAVVLRIESGGGSVSASDEIYRLAASLRQDLHKPLVVSMGGVAASGGYYIAAPADEIWAEPSTVTGSIGVIAMWPVFKGLMDKVGIEPVVIRSSHAEQWKAKENYMESPDPAVRKDVQDMLDAMQDRFEKIVRDGRGSKLVVAALPEATSRSVRRAEADSTTKPAQADPFNGKAYIADVAQKLGLVDKIGYLHEAAKAAADLAKLTNPKVVRYTLRTSLMDALLESESTGRDGGSVRIDADTFDNLTAPRILMVWHP